MKKILLSVIMSFTTVYISVSQAEIDFQSQTMTKELNKAGKSANLVLTEISSPASEAALNSGGKYFSVTDNTNQNPVKYIYIGRCYISRSPAGGGVKGGNEYFDYFIFYDAGITVRLVSIYNYKSAYGYGITNKSWLKQFRGYNINNRLILGKDVDAVSGASLSAGSLVNDVKEKTALLVKVAGK